MHGANYIEALYQAYKEGYIGTQHINKNSFARRLMYVAYGIIHEKPRWQDVPNADDIAKIFATKDGVSFAFMNISKFSNTGENWQADWELINYSFNASIGKGTNLIERQIALLSPDVIVTMNLGEKVNALGKELTEIKKTDNVNSYWNQLSSGKKALLLDSFHFSAVKKELDVFYDPICSAALEHFPGSGG